MKENLLETGTHFFLSGRKGTFILFAFYVISNIPLEKIITCSTYKLGYSEESLRLLPVFL